MVKSNLISGISSLPNMIPTEKWVTQLDTRGGVYGFGITADTNGIYVTGYSGGTLDGSSNAGGDDLIIVKYNTNGVRQ